MLTLFQLLKLNDIDPNGIKLVRHSNVEISILESYKTNFDMFLEYSSFQNIGKFGNAKLIAFFAPGRGTSAIFLGIWKIKESLSSENYTDEIHSIIDKHNFPKKWHNDSEHYVFEREPLFADFSERLIIEWGKATVAWVQSKDKEIIEIKPKNIAVDFLSYDDVQLSFKDLQQIVANVDSNYTWYSALSAVNGVYLIQDKSNGKLYVGSAYGENGIWGRWCTYSQNGHGGNIELKTCNPSNFEFSILEIVSSSVSFDAVIKRENRWKTKLGTREYGLNSN